MNRKYFFSLLGVFAAAFILRVLYLHLGALSFAYDQARDAFVVQEMLSGDLKILGPPVSGVPGLYHGILYYYIIAPIYYFTKDPVAVAYFMSFVSSLGVFAIFFFGYLLTKKLQVGLLSALVFAFSFEASQYANLLTNASMGVWFVPLAYLGMFLWLSKVSKWGPILAGLGLGLSLQSEIALGYHLIAFVFWFYYFGKNIVRNDMWKFGLSLFLSVLSMVMVELKFEFKGLAGLWYLFSSKDAITTGMEFGQFIVTFLNQTGRTFAHTLFPINVSFGGLLGFLLVFYMARTANKISPKNFPWRLFLLSYVLAHAVALPFGGSNMKHLMVGAVGGLSVMAGAFIWEVYRKSRTLGVIVLGIILFTNLIKIVSENPKGQTIFPLQQDLTLANEIKVIDYTYQKANGRPFSINTLTSPLYVNVLWSYLYNSRGLKKYGYLPYWTGKDQIGQLGNNLDFPPNRVDLHFYIIEPTYGIPSQYIVYSNGEEESKSVFVEEREFGELKVQERRIIN